MLEPCSTLYKSSEYKKTYALAIKERIQQGTLVKADNQGTRTLKCWPIKWNLRNPSLQASSEFCLPLTYVQSGNSS